MSAYLREGIERPSSGAGACSTVSSRSQHRCARPQRASRADVFARIGECHVSWNVLCLGMSSLIHSLTFRAHRNLCMDVYVRRRDGLHASAVHLVFCVLTCFVLYRPSPPPPPTRPVSRCSLTRCFNSCRDRLRARPRGDTALCRSALAFQATWDPALSRTVSGDALSRPGRLRIPCGVARRWTTYLPKIKRQYRARSLSGT